MIKHPEHTDIELKPSIAKIDKDQTYDLLLFFKLPLGFDKLFSKTSIPGWEVFLIDRFTTDKVIWAKNYSEHIFNLLNQFNFCLYHSLENRLLKDIFNQVLDTNGNEKPNENDKLDLTKLKNFQAHLEGDLSLIQDNKIIRHLGSWYKKKEGILQQLKKETRSLTNPGWDYLDDFTYFVHDGKAFLSLKDNVHKLNYNKNPDEWAEVGVSESEWSPNFDVYNSSTPYFVDLEEGEYTISFLVNNSLQQGFNNNYYFTINKTYFKFTLFEKTRVDINNLIKFAKNADNYFGHFCANSMIISKIENNIEIDISNKINLHPKFILYKDIKTYFNLVEKSLKQYLEGTLQNCLGIATYLPLQGYIKRIELNESIEFTGDPEDEFLPESFPTYLHPVGNYWKFYTDDFGTCLDHTIGILPDHFKNYCSLFRANNNRWNQEDYFLDLGIKDIFNFSPNFLYSNPKNTTIGIEYNFDMSIEVNDFGIIGILSPKYNKVFIDIDNAPFDSSSIIPLKIPARLSLQSAFLHLKYLPVFAKNSKANIQLSYTQKTGQNNDILWHEAIIYKGFPEYNQEGEILSFKNDNLNLNPNRKIYWEINLYSESEWLEKFSTISTTDFVEWIIANN